MEKSMGYILLGLAAGTLSGLIGIGGDTIINHSDFIEEELAFLKKVEEGLMKKYGFKITNHNLQFYGLCNHCKDQ